MSMKRQGTGGAGYDSSVGGGSRSFPLGGSAGGAHCLGAAADEVAAGEVRGCVLGAVFAAADVCRDRLGSHGGRCGSSEYSCVIAVGLAFGSVVGFSMAAWSCGLLSERRRWMVCCPAVAARNFVCSSRLVAVGAGCAANATG